MENNDKADWINTILSQMGQFEGDQAAIVLENCGRECLKSSGSLEEIEKLRNDIEDKNNIELLLNIYKEKIYQNRPDLYWENGDIYLEYRKCGCGMVNDGGVTDPFLCNCTVGYTKQIFETLFAKPVQVKLIKSILSGDSICKQRISVGKMNK
jgi:predicted hydrocarbon binding protein